MVQKIYLALIFLLLLPLQGVLAQPRLFPRPQPNPPSLPQPFPENPLTPNLPTPEIPPNLPSLPETITIESFDFQGNTAFSNEELRDIVASFTGRPITFAELLQAEAAINQAYVERGYLNSGAVIPAPQVLSPQGAVVTMQILEGEIEAINVRVEGRLRSSYIRSRLALATQAPFNQKRLLEALQLLQLNPLIATISAEITAGSAPQRSILTVQVKEADTFRFDVLVDNARIPSVGTIRRGFSFAQENLLGFGDAFSGDYYNTDGSNNFDLRYQVPLNPRNGSLSFAGGLTDSRIVEEPFNSLEVTGNSPYVEVTFRQPVLQSPRQELALGITASRQESSTELLGVNFPLSPGANSQGETRISSLRWFQDWTQRSPQQVWAVRSQFSFGLCAFQATVNQDAPDSRFFDWQAQGQYVRLLAPDTLLLLRSEIQLSANPLVPLEQFALGGVYSVRGYSQDALLTDNGFFASAEVRIALLRVKQGVLQAAPFLDVGVGWNHPDNPLPTPEDHTLLGIGLGMQWQMGDRFSLRLDWGIPLLGEDNGGDSLQEQGLYFSLNYRLF